MTRTPRSTLRRLDGDRGQATVEFALVLGVVALLIIGVVEIARVTAMQVAVVDAARVGARAAAVPSDSGAVPEPMTATITYSGQDPPLVTVRVERELHLVPALGWSSVRLTASSTMLVEDPAS